MSNVSFEDEQYSPSKRAIKSGGGIPAWVVGHSGGIIKSEAQASIVLVVFIVLSLFACYIILSFKTGTKAVIEAPTGYEVVRPQNAPPRLAPAR